MYRLCMHIVVCLTLMYWGVRVESRILFSVEELLKGSMILMLLLAWYLYVDLCFGPR